MNEYIKIEKKLGLSFKNQKLLENALNHSSLKNEDLGIQSNKDLEFIGDSVMYFIASKYIYNNETKISIGEMSIIRSNIISNQTFSVFANKLSLGKYIKTGKGQRKIGISDSMLSDCFEALIGAIYQDGSKTNAYKTLDKFFDSRIQIQLKEGSSKDAKSTLQEILQKQKS